MDTQMIRSFFTFLFFCFFLFSCQHSPYAIGNKSYKKQVKAFARSIAVVPLRDSFSTSLWIGTTNFNLRKPNFVIIHHTAQNSCDQTLKAFTTVKSQVSAHYVICKDGTIHHMLNDYLRAWHGGIARWGNNTDINSSSVGIEIDNNGFEPFTDQQINSLIQILSYLKKSFGIPAANFIGHADIAPARKNDPNVYFPWKLLADKGFGLWWNDTTAVQVPPDFNSMEALRIIGYDIKDSASVIRTFRRKFEQLDNDLPLNDDDRKIIYTLYKKYE